MNSDWRLSHDDWTYQDRIGSNANAVVRIDRPMERVNDKSIA